MTQETVSTPPAQTQTPLTNVNGAAHAPSVSHFRQPTMKKKTVRVHLQYPSMDREYTVKRRLSLDGRFRDERAQIDVPLHPGMAYNGGNDIDIDAERGIQTRYRGLSGWVGIDGRWSFAAEVRKHMANLQLRGFDFTKYAWPVAIVIAGAFAALTVIAALGMK